MDQQAQHNRTAHHGHAQHASMNVQSCLGSRGTLLSSTHPSRRLSWSFLAMVGRSKAAQYVGMDGALGEKRVGKATATTKKQSVPAASSADGAPAPDEGKRVRKLRKVEKKSRHN